MLDESFHILIIEDNPGDIRLLKEMIRQIETENSGVEKIALQEEDRLSEAFDYLAKNETDIVLLDLSLPDVQGLEGFRRLHNRHPQIPVIILTGQEDQELALKAMREGAQDFISKENLDARGLLRALRYSTERQRLRVELEEKTQKLAKSEKRFRKMIEKNSHGILILDENGSIKFVNPAGEKLFGQPRKILMKKNFGLPSIHGPSTEIDIHREDRDVIAEMSCVEIDWEGKPAYLTSLHEITGHKQLEHKLLKSHDFLQKALDSLSSHIAILDEKGEILTVNKAWRDFALENNLDDNNFCIGQNYLEICEKAGQIGEKGAAEIARAMGQIISGERENYFRVYPCHSPNQKRWFTLRVTSFISENHLHLVVAHENVTERKLIEEDLRRSESRFREIASNIPGIVFQFKLDKNRRLSIPYISKSSILLKKIDFPSIQRDPSQITDLIVDEDRFAFLRSLREAMASESNWSREFRIRDKVGKIHWLRGSATIWYREKEGYLFNGVLLDITEKREAEEALRESEQRLKTLIRLLPEGVILLNNDYKILISNPAAQKHIQTLNKEKGGDKLERLGPKSTESLLEKCSKQERVELEKQTPSGLVYSFQISAQSILLPQTGQSSLLVLRDVTHSKQLQRQVETQERLAAIGQLASGIAHDFNNILQNIMGYAELLKGSEEISHQAQEDLDIISRQGQRASQLIEQILDFSRRSVSEMNEFDLYSFVKEEVQLLRRTLPENIEITTNFDKGTFSILGDPTKIQQILTNLAVNARDAMAEGGKLTLSLREDKLSPSFQSKAQAHSGPWVCLSVSDTGMGISSENLRHIFEPFFTTKKAGEGTGLGLAQVYGLVKQHRGFIDVTSEEGEGTTFDLYFPLITSHKSSKGKKDDSALQAGMGEKILVVEDEEQVLNLLEKMLSRLGYQVLTACHGEEALEIFEEKKEVIDLILTDMTMPVMGGKKLTENLLQISPESKIVVLTGYPLKEDVDQRFKNGIAGWLQKPVNLKELSQMVRHILGN